MAKLEVTLMADISEIESMIDGIKHLQTYKLSAEDEQILVDRDDVVKIFADHVRATIEPERKKGKFIGTEYDGYADGSPVYYEWKCSECGCIFEDEEPNYNFCPNCGAYMGKGR